MTPRIRAIRKTLGENVAHRYDPDLNNRIEQDYRGIKQHYYPMVEVGSTESDSRFCRGFDEQHHFFRMCAIMRQRVPSLVEQRRD